MRPNTLVLFVLTLFLSTVGDQIIDNDGTAYAAKGCCKEWNKKRRVWSPLWKYDFATCKKANTKQDKDKKVKAKRGKIWWDAACS